MKKIKNKKIAALLVFPVLTRKDILIQINEKVLTVQLEDVRRCHHLAKVKEYKTEV